WNGGDDIAGHRQLVTSLARLTPEDWCAAARVSHIDILPALEGRRFPWLSQAASGGRRFADRAAPRSARPGRTSPAPLLLSTTIGTFTRRDRRNRRTGRRRRPWLSRAIALRAGVGRLTGGQLPATGRSLLVGDRILGRTGRGVSVIGLGTWQLGADWGEVDDKDALAVL